MRWQATRWNDLDSKVPTALALGNFDGVHAGHRLLLRTLRDAAEKRGLRAAAVTFYPHPRLFFGLEPAFPLLTAPWEKEELIRELGCNAINTVLFDAEFARKDKSVFVEEFIRRRMRAHLLVLGPDYRFGRGAAGNLAYLREHFCGTNEDLLVVDPVIRDGVVVSSTRIRHQLREGDIEGACELLGAPFFYSGKVVAGTSRGRKLGFPTANLESECAEKIMVPCGVYAGLARLDGESWDAVVNVGSAPTFSGRKIRVEGHLLGFRRKIYGQRIRLELHFRLRDEIKFDDAEALVHQIRMDVQMARERRKRQNV